MSMANVAGVSVDTRHFIGGERIASAQTFADHSPIDGVHLADLLGAVNEKST